MNVDYKSNKLRKICEDPCLAQKKWGKQIGGKLAQRVSELVAADCLEDISKIPAAELHKLEGNRKEQYAVTLVHPFRLVFSPILDDGVSIDELKYIELIRIEEVLDYHGKQKQKR